MNLKKLVALLPLAIACTFSLYAQQTVPTSGDVTVRLAEPIDFATARPLQAVRATVVSSTNPAIPAGSPAALQLQNRDASYTLKLLRIVVPGQMMKTMSQGGVAVSGPPASGPHASLAAGALVRFTLTQADGSPGAAPQQAAPVAAAPSAPVRGAAKVELVLEGVGLGMTKQQVIDAGKAHGSVRGLHDTGNGYPEMQTSDLLFKSIQFNDAGVVWSYTATAINPKRLKSGNTSGPLFDMVVAAFGKPNVVGRKVSWGVDQVGQGNAMYSYDSDEAPNGLVIVSNGLQ